MKLIKIRETRKCFLEAAGMYCGRFILDDENSIIINRIIQWLDGDPAFNQQYAFGMQDLSKGIMLIGNPGSGKTTILEIIQAITRKTPLTFRKHATTNIIDEFSKSGPEYLKQLKGNIFFDDLGFEKTAIHFGDKRELMQDVIFSRYDQMRGYDRSISHFTSMMKWQDIEAKYGPFAWSRLKQMCNIFLLGASSNSCDRRTMSIINDRPPIEKMPRLYVTEEEFEEIKDREKIRKAYEAQSKEPHVKSEYKGLGSQIRDALDNHFKK